MKLHPSPDREQLRVDKAARQGAIKTKCSSLQVHLRRITQQIDSGKMMISGRKFNPVPISLVRSADKIPERAGL